MKKIVILGAGTGGTLIANRLYRRLWHQIKSGDIEITIIEPNYWHYYQPGFLLLPLNLVAEDELRRPVKELLPEKIKLIREKAEKIDVENKQVNLANGDKVDYNYLIISTGSRLNYIEVPGLRDGTYNFYGFDEAIRLREALRNFREGTIVVGVAGVPYKCPPAPIEMSLLLDAYYRKLGIRDKIKIKYAYPLPRVFPIAEAADMLDPIMRNRDIDIHLFFNVEEIDPENKVIKSMEGEELEYDLSIMIPPHRGSDVIINSGIGDAGGWVPTDRYTLNMEGHEDIYVIGDATNLPISKAGSVADFEAEVIVSRLIDQLNGHTPMTVYNGKVMCFVLTGIGEGTILLFNYNEPPKPVPPGFSSYWLKLIYNKLYWSLTAGSALVEVS